MSVNPGVVLVVDDDADVGDALHDVLTDAGFTVVVAQTGAHGRAMFRELEPAVVLLDLGLPDVAGLDLLVELTATRPTPIIVLSARGGEADRAVGLDLGADDYIVKPFAPRELVARVRAAVRRTARDARVETTFGALTIDGATREVTVEGRPVALTAKEFDLLAFLAGAPRHVFSRRQILQHVWGSSPAWQNDATVPEHVHRLRKKLDSQRRSRWIETVKGVGYRFSPSD
jgi:two-component system, OmpR family, phosphate regulon response regulator PhoB